MPRHRHAPTRRPGSVLLRWGAALVGLAVLAIGSAELLMRSFPDHLPPAMQFRLHDDAINDNELNSVPDKEFGYLWRPRISERMEGFNFAFDYSTDANGFRNSGPWPERADVVVLGDSQAFGFGVDDQDVWVRHMAEDLPGLTIVNLGLIGAAPQQFERIYEAFGRELRPEIVLLGLFPPLSIDMAQRFDDWVADGRSDRFDIRRMKGAGDENLVRRIKAGLGNSYAALGLWYGLKAALGQSDLRTMSFEDGRVRLVSTRYGDTAAAVRTQRPDFMRVIEILDRLRDEVRADGAELIVLPFPTKEEIHLPLLGEQPHVLTGPFEQALEAHGIPWLDLEQPLEQGVEAGRDLFFEIDLHPNPTGQKVVACTVTDELRKHFGARTVEARRAPPRPWAGDPSQAAARAGAPGSRASAASITSGPAPF